MNSTISQLDRNVRESRFLSSASSGDTVWVRQSSGEKSSYIMPKETFVE
ncbi:MAG: hypothetical protein OXP36_04015 [Gammaproteobacteria bacterium]|nr:hypothetical protein [Gammaproteobacteria bacterium]